MADSATAALDPTISQVNKNEKPTISQENKNIYKNKGNEEKEKEAAAAGGDTFLSACFWILFTISISMIFLDAVLNMLVTAKDNSWNNVYNTYHNIRKTAPLTCGFVGAVCGVLGAYGVSSGGGVGKNQPRLRKLLKVSKFISLALSVLLVLALFIITARLHYDHVMPVLEMMKQHFDEDFEHRKDYRDRYIESASKPYTSPEKFLIPFQRTHAGFLIAELIVAFAFCSLVQVTAVLLIAVYGTPQVILNTVTCCKFICPGAVERPPQSGPRQKWEDEDAL